MLQLFLKYNPVKFTFVFLLLVLIRLVAYWLSIPLTDPEITWLLVGESMTNGFSLYNEIWTSVEPLSAFVYFLIDLLWGKSLLAYFILSLLLVFLQAALLTNGLAKNKVFKERTMLPALFYVLFSSLFFDFYTLSPVLLGSTFIIYAFNRICLQTKVATTEERFFYIGLFTGIASLFYFPFIVFLIFSLFSLGFYTNTSLKQQMVLVLAFLFPHIMILIYYFWTDNLGNYFTYALFNSFYATTAHFIDIPAFIKIAVVPLLLLLAGAANIISNGRYVHYQYNIIKISGFWVLIGIVAMSLERSFSAHVLYLFVSPLAIFTTHLFLNQSKKKIASEVAFWAFFGGILLISFYALQKPDAYTTANFIKTAPPELASLKIEDKKIIVLGDKKEYYINNRIACPYVEWPLAKWQFQDLQKYENISAIYEVITVNKPDYIMDVDSKMKRLYVSIPSLAKDYEQLDTSVVYRRKN